ncbi:MAG: hypothetical protein FWD55_08655 [Propionibacteriaceae bacterium]|nr:hypothetical protein [Propionibacteriaceae bacterium]
MPTLLPRYTITETPDIKECLDEAAQAWPELGGNRKKLLKKLIEAGRREVSAIREEDLAKRRKTIEEASGSMTGVWPRGWYEQYKQDEWPA